MVMTISLGDPPTILLENGSLVHNQTNMDRNRNYWQPLSRECFQMILWSKQQTRTILGKVRMIRKKLICTLQAIRLQSENKLSILCVCKESNLGELQRSSCEIEEKVANGIKESKTEML